MRCVLRLLCAMGKSPTEIAAEVQAIRRDARLAWDFKPNIAFRLSQPSGRPHIPHTERERTRPMPTVDAATFQRDFSRLESVAQRASVRIADGGHAIVGFLSIEDLDRYERLKRRERQV